MNISNEVLCYLAAQAAAFEAVLLAASAVHKMLKWSDSVQVVRLFAGLPSWLAPPALGAAIVTEGSAACLLLVAAPALRTVGAILAALLWTGYLGLIVRAVLQGRRDVDCGCSFGRGRHLLGRYQLVRNIMLLGASVAVAALDSTRGAVAIPMSQLLSACALLALYGAMDQTMGLGPLRKGVTESVF